MCHHSFLTIANGSLALREGQGVPQGGQQAVGNVRYIHKNRSSLLAGTDPANGYDTECAQTIFVGHVARRILATTDDKLIQPTEEMEHITT